MQGLFFDEKDTGNCFC